VPILAKRFANVVEIAAPKRWWVISNNAYESICETGIGEWGIWPKNGLNAIPAGGAKM
jgi:hypothetical protein